MYITIVVWTIYNAKLNSSHLSESDRNVANFEIDVENETGEAVSVGSFITRYLFVLINSQNIINIPVSEIKGFSSYDYSVF